MNYKEIEKEIKIFESMTSKEIQDKVKPIIKSYNRDFLSKHIGISKSHLYRMCKKLFVDNNEKIEFATYVKIMSLGINYKKKD